MNEHTRFTLTRRQALFAGASLALPGCSAAAARPPGVDPVAPIAGEVPCAVDPVSLRLRIAETQLSMAGPPTKAVLVNDQLPGPEIRVKEGDLLRVTVENTLDEPTSVHWHGLLVPNPMDGVPGVTQQAIPAGQAFVYEYTLRQTGTYWYHSHVGFQEQQGLHGPLIIEPRREAGDYDREFVIFLSDWPAEACRDR